MSEDDKSDVAVNVLTHEPNPEDIVEKGDTDVEDDDEAESDEDHVDEKLAQYLEVCHNVIFDAFVVKLHKYIMFVYFNFLVRRRR